MSRLTVIALSVFSVGFGATLILAETNAISPYPPQFKESQAQRSPHDKVWGISGVVGAGEHGWRYVWPHELLPQAFNGYTISSTPIDMSSRNKGWTQQNWGKPVTITNSEAKVDVRCKRDYPESTTQPSPSDAVSTTPYEKVEFLDVPAGGLGRKIKDGAHFYNFAFRDDDLVIDMDVVAKTEAICKRIALDVATQVMQYRATVPRLELTEIKALPKSLGFSNRTNLTVGATVDGFVIEKVTPKTEKKVLPNGKTITIDVSELTLKLGEKTITLVKGRREVLEEKAVYLRDKSDKRYILTMGDEFNIGKRNLRLAWIGYTGSHCVLTDVESGESFTIKRSDNRKDDKTLDAEGIAILEKEIASLSKQITRAKDDLSEYENLIASWKKPPLKEDAPARQRKAHEILTRKRESDLTRMKSRIDRLERTKKQLLERMRQ